MRPDGLLERVDYAQVSTDDGDQFHMLGTPPRGQQGAGGGGDCALATGVTPNGRGNYQYAYAGLGALTGFTTSTSPNNGHSLATAGADATGGITTQGVLADRQWMTFIDDHTVLLSWNQQEPRNVVVQKSTDGGLTYSPVASIAAPNRSSPGPMRFIAAQNVVYMPWTKGEQVNLAVSRDGGTTWTDCKVASGDTVKGGTAGFAVADHDSAGNVYVVWADSSDYHTWLATLAADKLAGCNEPVADGRGDSTTASRPSTPASRRRCRSTATPSARRSSRGSPQAARRAASPSRSTARPSDGDPNTGDVQGRVERLRQPVAERARRGAHVQPGQATTHPFHYDSICLNGLGCDLAAPAGDRTLADFFAIGYNPANGRLSVVFDRDNKKPDEAPGHVATPMVFYADRRAVERRRHGHRRGRAVVRTSSTDPTGDALSSYSLTAPAVAPPDPPTKNEAAADFTRARSGPDAATGGFTVTLKVADLSTAALTQALADTGGQSLQWVWRFTNGYQDAAASAAGTRPPAGRSATTATPPAARRATARRTRRARSASSTRRRAADPGRVDQAAGTITLIVPKTVLRQLSGSRRGGPAARVGGRERRRASTTAPRSRSRTRPRRRRRSSRSSTRSTTRRRWTSCCRRRRQGR